MPATTKTVYILLPGAATAIGWTSRTPAQVAAILSRWDAARNGGGPDALVFTQGPYEYHLDLTKVTGLMVSA